MVINEAVELAKTYSTERSGRFVNGVLSKLALEERAADIDFRPSRNDLEPPWRSGIPLLAAGPPPPCAGEARGGRTAPGADHPPPEPPPFRERESDRGERKTSVCRLPSAVSMSCYRRLAL